MRHILSIFDWLLGVRCGNNDAMLRIFFLLGHYFLSISSDIIHSSHRECAVLHYLLCMLLHSPDHPYWLEAFEGY